MFTFNPTTSWRVTWWVIHWVCRAELGSLQSNVRKKKHLVEYSNFLGPKQLFSYSWVPGFKSVMCQYVNVYYVSGSISATGRSENIVPLVYRIRCFEIWRLRWWCTIENGPFSTALCVITWVFCCSHQQKVTGILSGILLVGGLEHFFSIHWECHHPNWRTPSFFRGVGIPPTSLPKPWANNYMVITMVKWMVYHGL